MRTDSGLLILRLGFGGLMLFSHGLPKLLKFNELKGSFFAPLEFMGPQFSLILCLLAEVVCAILVILGVAFRPALALLIITMLVAAFMVHANDPFAKQEFALLFAIAFVALFVSGPGRYVASTGRRS